MTIALDDPEFVCVWCERRATDRASFPACSTRCRDAAARYRSCRAPEEHSMWDDDEHQGRDLELPPAVCTECGAPRQTAADHYCRQCAAHCLVELYRRGGPT